MLIQISLKDLISQEFLTSECSTQVTYPNLDKKNTRAGKFIKPFYLYSFLHFWKDLACREHNAPDQD